DTCLPAGGPRQGRRLEARSDGRSRRSARLGRKRAFDPLQAPTLDDRAAEEDSRCSEWEQGNLKVPPLPPPQFPLRFSSGGQSFSSLTAKLWRKSFSLETSASGTSRTVKKTFCTDVSLGSTRAVRTPFLRNSARRERAASSVLNTPREIANRNLESSCTI